MKFFLALNLSFKLFRWFDTSCKQNNNNAEIVHFVAVHPDALCFCMLQNFSGHDLWVLAITFKIHTRIKGSL